MQTSSSRFLLALLGSGALMAYSGAAFAQAAQSNAPDELLGEVIVTATKQADVISRVPMSVVAQTQKSLDAQNVKTAQDLNRVVPSLVITANGQTGSNISIRGIRSAGIGGGAATTGVYLDDTALQSRSLSGIANGGGAFLPVLFDLERVEVLKGPQGTLYGGSSEGGTIKFITPAPSVTKYSAYAKAEINSIYDGSMGYTGGVAVGGPIIQDKIGFRASIYYNHIGGWVDHLDRNKNGAVMEADTNKENQRSARIAFLLKPNERLSITPAVYMAYDKKADADTVFIDMAQYTVPTRYFSAPLAGGSFTRLAAGPGGTPPVVTTPGAGLITAPGYTIGPYNFLTNAKYGSLINTLVGENYANSIQSTPVKTPRTSTLFLPSLTMQYDFDHMQVKSITSYSNDRAKGNSQLVLQEPISASTTAGTQASSDPSTLGVSSFNPYTPLFNAIYYNKSARSGISEELRFSSEANARPFNWVAGFFVSSYHQHSYAYDAEDTNILFQSLYGVGQDRRYVASIAGRPFVGYQDQSDRESKLNETEIAGFGEANLYLTSKLRINGGVRISRNELVYYTAGGGLLSAPSSVSGTTIESPITPKFGISYQLTDDDLLYFNAAKGYRPGGVNAPITKGGRCDADLANLGIDSTPATFDSDTVWSYEGGAKLKLGNRVSLAGSVFYIKWNKPQINFTLPLCVATYATNAGEAVSKGFDLQGNIRLLPGLTSNFTVGYTDAYYPKSILGPINGNTGIAATLVNAGDKMPTVPAWQATLGVQYDFDVMSHAAYFRADFQYISKAVQSSYGPGTTGYAPDSFYQRENQFVNLRLGMNVKGVDFSVFADNVLNEDRFTPATLSGRSGCSVTTGAACSTFSSYYYLVSGTRPRPRVVGATAIYRY